MSTIKTKKTRDLRFVKVGISVPTPLSNKVDMRLEAIRRRKPEYNFSDYVRDALRSFVSGGDANVLRQIAMAETSEKQP